MIVQRAQVKPQIQIEFLEENESNVQELVISLGIKELENIYTFEEGKYLDNLLILFNEKWRAIPFGEEMMWIFMDFCQKKDVLPLNFFIPFDSQIR